MAIIVHQHAGAWVRWPGVPNIDPAKVAKLIDDGVWTAGDLEPYGARLAVPFVAPVGEIIKPFGLETFEEVGGIVHQIRETIPAPRRMVRKSTIIARLTDQQLEDAMALLDIRQAERWRAPDQPRVYFDDPDTVAVLTAVGADVATVMREGDDP